MGMISILRVLPSVRPSVRPSIHSVPTNVCSYSFVCWLFDRSVGASVRPFVRSFCLVAWLPGWLVGWLVGSFVRFGVFVALWSHSLVRSFVLYLSLLHSCVTSVVPARVDGVDGVRGSVAWFWFVVLGACFIRLPKGDGCLRQTGCVVMKRHCLLSVGLCLCR